MDEISLLVFVLKHQTTDETNQAYKLEKMWLVSSLDVKSTVRSLS